MIQYSKTLLIFLICITLVAFGLTAFFATSLNNQIDLFDSHEIAMTLDELDDSDSFSIFNISNNINNLRWDMYAAITTSVVGLFLLGIILIQQISAWKDKNERVGAESFLINNNETSYFRETLSIKNYDIRNSFVRDLSRNQLVQFSIASFGIMVILAVSISAIVATRLNLQMDLLASHGAAMMSGTLEPTDPFSIQNMIGEVSTLIETVIITVSVAFVLLYLSLVTIFWRGGIERKHLETNLRATLAEAESIAKTDFLSGLLNRGAIQEKAKLELNQAEREATNVSFILLDIDKFKQINDRFGHLMGDLALKSLANNLKEYKRPYDSIGRWGGDEFMMILPGANLEEAATFANRIKRLVGSLEIELPDRRAIKLKVSLGVSSNSENNVKKITMRELLDQADQAMYKAKQDGRN